MGLVDSHCHLDLIQERDIELDAILNHSIENKVTAILQIATTLSSSKWNRQLLLDRRGLESPKLFWTAGLHPQNANDLSELDDLMDFIRQHAREPLFWGIGETGLDYFHTSDYKENQIKSFEKHLELAQELKLPIVLHTRDDKSYNPDKIGSIKDALTICKKYPEVKGVLHCFTYTDKEALGFVEMGWYVSYSGVVTFKNARDVQKGALNLPLDRLLVETDAPFLAPEPHRGKTNLPGYVSHTLDFLVNLIASHRAEDPQHIRNQILKNSNDFLDLKNQMK